MRVAILVGLATVPFTLALSWGAVGDDSVVAGGFISGEVLLLAGLIVGYYYSDRETESRRAGVWAGLAGSLAGVIVVTANTVATIGSASSRWAAAAVIATPFVLAFGVGFTVLITTIAAQFAGWVTTRLDRDRHVFDPADGEDRPGPASKYWKTVAAYVLTVPPVLGYVLLELSESTVGIFLSVLGLLLLVPLAVFALVALFVDVTAPRPAGTDWTPNVLAYVGAPLATYGFVYAVGTVREATNPAGYAMYAFIGVLWLAAVVYLANRHRYFDGSGSTSSHLM